MQVSDLVPLVRRKCHRLHDAVSACRHSAICTQGSGHLSCDIPVIAIKATSIVLLGLCYKGLHLHIPGSHQRTGDTIQIYAFIPLVDMERNVSVFLFIRTSEPRLYLKGRLQLFR